MIKYKDHDLVEVTKVVPKEISSVFTELQCYIDKPSGVDTRLRKHATLILEGAIRSFNAGEWYCSEAAKTQCYATFGSYLADKPIPRGTSPANIPNTKC